MSSEFVFSAQSDHSLQATKKPPDPQILPSQKISFRDKLLGPSQETQIREKEDMIANKLVRIEHENGNRLLPKVYLEPSVFQELCTPWKDAIVVKLLGKNLGYHTMKERLQKTWRPQGGFEIMDNDNGFYMVKFDQAADKEKVITGGPWLIFDHCLAVTHWSPEFASPNAKVNKTIVWVRFPGLNLVYYDESFLLAMASALGRPVKVDTNTLKIERGKFARVCVEIDLTVPVVGKIWVNGHWYKVQYEGLHLICTGCGCYGHLGRNCTNMSAHTTTIVSPQSQTASLHSHQPHSIPESSKGTAVTDSTKELLAHNGNIISINGENNELHGDWLLVTRKKKLPKNPTLISSKTVTPKTNRFNALNNLTHKTKADTPHIQTRPNQCDQTRVTQTPKETKRRRHDDVTNAVPIFEFSPVLTPVLSDTKQKNPPKSTYVEKNISNLPNNQPTHFEHNKQAIPDSTMFTLDPMVTTNHINSNPITQNTQETDNSINVSEPNEEVHDNTVLVAENSVVADEEMAT